jgi:hypothetical protein
MSNGLSRVDEIVFLVFLLSQANKDYRERLHYARVMQTSVIGIHAIKGERSIDVALVTDRVADVSHAGKAPRTRCVFM